MIYLGDLLRLRRFSYSLVLYYSWLKYDNVQKWVIPAGLRLLSLESPSCKSGPQLASRNFDLGRVPTIMANCAWTVCANNIVYAEYLLVFGRNLGHAWKQVPMWPAPVKNLGHRVTNEPPWQTAFHRCHNSLLGNWAWPVWLHWEAGSWVPPVFVSWAFFLCWFCFVAFCCKKS